MSVKMIKMAATVHHRVKTCSVNQISPHVPMMCACLFAADMYMSQCSLMSIYMETYLWCLIMNFS